MFKSIIDDIVCITKLNKHKTLCVPFIDFNKDKYNINEMIEYITINLSNSYNGYFHEKYINYGMNPKIIDLSENTEENKMEMIEYLATDDFVINIYQLLVILLDKEIPENILIMTSNIECEESLSDNEGVIKYKQYFEKEETIAKFQNIKNMYSSKGYTIPKIIFWNINDSEINILDNNGIMEINGGIIYK